jgi:hypothetical protein
MRDFIASQNSERLRQRLSRGLTMREPPAFTRLAKSLFDMALVTGIVARIYRSLVLSRAESPTGTYVVVTLSIGAIFILLMASLHLGRFPLRDWLWRAPAFAALEGAAEMVTSAVLIALGREPLGTAAATFRDWPAMLLRTVGWRVVTISLFALLLAGIVKWVRFLLLKREHVAWSDGTVQPEGFVERRRR